MQRKLKKQNWRRRLWIGILLSASVLTSGCKTPVRLDNTKTLVEGNPKGFSDAVHSSPEGRRFVEDTLGVIIDLEFELEKGGKK